MAEMYLLLIHLSLDTFIHKTQFGFLFLPNPVDKLHLKQEYTLFAIFVNISFVVNYFLESFSIEYATSHRLPK